MGAEGILLRAYPVRGGLWGERMGRHRRRQTGAHDPITVFWGEDNSTPYSEKTGRLRDRGAQSVYSV